MKLLAACLLLGLALVRAAPAAPTPRAAKFDSTALLQLYWRYGLPLLPPDGAGPGLVLHGVVNGTAAREHRHPAFALQPEAGTERIRWHGDVG